MVPLVLPCRIKTLFQLLLLLAHIIMSFVLFVQVNRRNASIRAESLLSEKDIDMALVQGRCKNCGSIINVDTAKEDAVCMFCWAHTSPSEALAIEANPEAYEFPNEEMTPPSAEEHALAFGSLPGSNAGVVKRSQPAIKKNKEKKLTPAEKVAMAKKDVYEPTVPNKQKIMMLAIGLAIVILTAAIVVPLTLSRNSKREALQAKMSNFIPGQSLQVQNYSFEGQNNSKLTLVLPETISEAQVSEIYKNFKTMRAEVYELTADDSQSDARIKIYAMNGLHEMNGNGEIINNQ